MANFVADQVIFLSNFQPSPDTTSASWELVFDLPADNTVQDATGDGVLTPDDFIVTGSFQYSGYYIIVEGKNYGIFVDPEGGDGIIPFSSELAGGRLSVPFFGTTTLYDASLENAANCFLSGTRIATPDGERAIETLQPGDLVRTAEGTAKPVLWVWKQEITNIFGLGEARAPVRVAAHSLGPGCPARDLIVTADHALVVDGLLINAGALVNGTTIRPEPLSRMPASFTYWHIETEDHSVLLAENCPAESFVDYTPRDAFDNHAAYLERYGEGRIIQEMPLIRISTPRLLSRDLRARLGITRAA